VTNPEDTGTLAFGPVPSRRLGRSLGINNIPAKNCSYSCVYCQVGKTTNMTCERRAFHEPKDIVTEVEGRICKARLRSETIDYLAFVPDGEPTLDMNLGNEISILKRTGIRVAVLSNASLIWRQDVRRALQKSDVVSLKVDAVSETIWRRINRPHRTLRLDLILKGIAAFAREFKGTLMSETMLIGNIPYGDEFERISKFLGNLEKLNRAYIAVPTRPPTESWVEPPQEKILNTAFQTFSETLGVDRVEYLIGYEGNAFAFTGNIEEDLLNITAVHPMRREAVEKLLKKASADWQVITQLLRESKIKCIEFEGNTYYMREFSGKEKTKEKRQTRSTTKRIE
jgi:wyosine [tRNA(Phe)-imidazoG37] synthetase (radical SAM superfamily)